MEIIAASLIGFLVGYVTRGILFLYKTPDSLEEHLKGWHLGYQAAWREREKSNK